MASEQTIKRIEQVIWILIYAGLFMLIVGLASLSASPTAAWSLIVVGSVVALVGVVLIWVRSRLRAPG